MPKICKAVPDQSHPKVWPESDLQGLILQCFWLSLASRKGLDGRWNTSPGDLFQERGPFTQLQKITVSIKRLSHSRSVDRVGVKTGRGVDPPAGMLSPPKGLAQPLPGALEHPSFGTKQRLQSRVSLEVALRGPFAFGSGGHRIQTQLDGQKGAQLLLGPLVVKLHVWSKAWLQAIEMLEDRWSEGCS